ncbi:MAG: dephospho-CoA kinase [Dehalococcoidia bacterium]|nr:dephospho-CoA kinase [Dehalococcoidia bacterium]
MLRDFGATVIDADRLGHRSYEPGTPGFQKVVNAFGHDIVAKDGTIDRRVLGGKVFGAPGQLERLNAIVWPEIRTLIKDEIKQIRSQEEDPIIVLEAAVLLEAKWQDLCDEVWVVVTPVKTAVARLHDRNGLTTDAAMARINAQMSNKERTDLSDVKIENAADEEALRQRVERAWKALLTRRGKKPSNAKATKTGSRKASASREGDPEDHQDCRRGEAGQQARREGREQAGCEEGCSEGDDGQGRCRQAGGEAGRQGGPEGHGQGRREAGRQGSSEGHGEGGCEACRQGDRDRHEEGRPEEGEGDGLKAAPKAKTAGARSK